jgi:hypothetical protein
MQSIKTQFKNLENRKVPEWEEDDAKWWAELPAPETLPGLLNHSGTNEGSLLSISTST